MFKKFSTGFGALCVAMGIMVMAGAAGDCDGACMEQANDIPTMLMLAGMGLILMLGGVFFVAVGQGDYEA